MAAQRMDELDRSGHEDRISLAATAPGTSEKAQSRCSGKRPKQLGCPNQKAAMSCLAFVRV